MEQYKEKLKKQNIFLILCIAVLAVFAVLGFAAETGAVNLTPATGDSHWQSMWRGFLSGASMGVLALMVYGLVCNLRAIKNDKQLKKLYIKEHDERSIQIWTAARSTAMQIFLMVGVVAAIVAGYFSMTVSITIIVCMFLQSITGFFCMLYYRIKL